VDRQRPLLTTSPIALLTDFGTTDIYVGVMKGVIFGIAPQAAVIDLGHHLAPQNLVQASFTLKTAYRYFPGGTVFCCVVDPGVGTSRQAVAVEIQDAAGIGRLIVCPDNGILTPFLDEEQVRRAVELDRPHYHLTPVSATFHGRDIFAPVAAHLARGATLEQVGSDLAPNSLLRLEMPKPRQRGHRWQATIIHTDHFGNLITNLPGKLLTPPLRQWQVLVGGQRLQGIERTFAVVADGQGIAYLGSSGHLEIAIRGGNAQRTWGLEIGATIWLEPISGDGNS